MGPGDIEKCCREQKRAGFAHENVTDRRNRPEEILGRHRWALPRRADGWKRDFSIEF